MSAISFAAVKHSAAERMQFGVTVNTQLGLALQKRYGIQLEADSEDTRQHFANLHSLAALVEARRVK